jgi:hypothetical protein
MPKTLKVINDLVVKIAVDIGLEDGPSFEARPTLIIPRTIPCCGMSSAW